MPCTIWRSPARSGDRSILWPWLPRIFISSPSLLLRMHDVYCDTIFSVFIYFKSSSNNQSINQSKLVYLSESWSSNHSQHHLLPFFHLLLSHHLCKFVRKFVGNFLVFLVVEVWSKFLKNFYSSIKKKMKKNVKVFTICVTKLKTVILIADGLPRLVVYKGPINRAPSVSRAHMTFACWPCSKIINPRCGESAGTSPARFSRPPETMDTFVCGNVSFSSTALFFSSTN